MMHLCRRRMAFALFSGTLLTTHLIWAQNENETVGFQTTHVFESGQFGENVDVMNGGLSLSHPIGPRFQVSDRLSYQLVLSYNSKIWDYSNYQAGTNDSVRAFNEGPAGIGWTLSFGRLQQDAHWTRCTTTNCYRRTWKWIGQDGGQHDVWFKEDSGGNAEPTTYPLTTADTTYVLVDREGASCTPQQGETTCRLVYTPDGLVYTLGHRLTHPDTTNQDERNTNLSFDGWYVTRIEDRSVGSSDPANGNLYPNHVLITYDTRSGFEHAIKEIRDSVKANSVQRVITFHNCRHETDGSCVDTPTTAAPQRSQVATYQIDVPAFSGADGGTPSEDPVPSAIGSYRLKHSYGVVSRPVFPGVVGPAMGPVLHLNRLDYPIYTRPNQSQQTYSVYFHYSSYGELVCRTLPLLKDESKSCSSWYNVETYFSYAYDYYLYMPLYLSAGPPRPDRTGKVHPGFVFDATPTRAVVAKSVNEPQAGDSPRTSTWTYTRSISNGLTNPYSARVTDPMANDTVYSYRASLAPSATLAAGAGAEPDDGLAPEWDDGLNYRIEYYRGTGTGRQLLRSENRDYDSDSTTAGVVPLSVES